MTSACKLSTDISAIAILLTMSREIHTWRSLSASTRPRSSGFRCLIVTQIIAWIRRSSFSSRLSIFSKRDVKLGWWTHGSHGWIMEKYDWITISRARECGRKGDRSCPSSGTKLDWSTLRLLATLDADGALDILICCVGRLFWQFRSAGAVNELWLSSADRFAEFAISNAAW